MGLFLKTNQMLKYKVEKNYTGNVVFYINNGEVAISVPWYLSNRKINQLVKDKKNSILNLIKDFDKSNNEKSHLNKNIISVFGQNYNLKINYKLIKSPELSLKEKVIIVNLPLKYRNIDNSKILKIIVDKFYFRLAENEVEKIMEKYRIKLKLAPNDYRIECLDGVLGKYIENKKEILINPEIVKYNRNILEYVILHQICHLKYKTHCNNFYKIIAKYIPNYKQIEIEINGMY